MCKKSKEWGDLQSLKGGTKSKSLPMKKRWLKNWVCVGLSLCFFLLSMLCTVECGVYYRKNDNAHWTPNYDKKNILPLLLKESRTEADYDVLYAQTGLTALGIEDLIAIKNYSRILAIQESYFKEYKIYIKEFAPFTYTKKIHEDAEVALLQNGDIFLSSSAFTSWFEYGHSALVVDGEKEFLVDSVTIGKNSALTSIKSLKSHAKFLILRPTVDEETRSAVAKYAWEHLTGKPYDFTVGILSPKYSDNLQGTHCAHLVWYAYKRFGIDLDSTGGRIVTPQDLANSPHLQLVQTFGFDPQTLWS